MPPTLLPARTETAPVWAKDSVPAFKLLRQAIALIDEHMIRYRGDPFATGGAWLKLARLANDLDTLLGELGRWTNEAMPGKQLIIPGYGVVERSQRKNDTWLHRDTAAAVIDREWAPGETALPLDVADLLMRFGAFGYWRKTALKDAGIPFDQLVHTAYGAKTLTVVSTNA